MSQVTTVDVLRRIGLLQGSAETLGNCLGRYVYAYFDPQDWRDAMDDSFGGEGALDAPTPFYVGIGKGKRFADHIGESLSGKEGKKRDKIRELIDAGSAPDIRFLAYDLPVDEEVEGDRVSRILETVLINLYGAEGNVKSSDSFERRMGFPASLTNKAASSTKIKSGTVATVSGSVTWVDDSGEGFEDVNELVREVKGKYGVDHVVTIGISGSYDSNANIDQLKEITCRWWNPGSMLNEEKLEGSLAILGWCSDPTLRWEEEGKGVLTYSVPVVRSAFIVEAGEREQMNGRISFKEDSEFNGDLWRDVVGRHLTHTAAQLQGQKIDGVNTSPAGVVETLEIIE